MREAALLVVALFLAAGCVEGEPRYFEDESTSVASLRVNAYTEPETRVAKIEVRGLDAQGNERAFTGTITLKVEAQDRSRVEHTYRPLEAWTVEVDADDFASPTVPMYVHEVEPETLGGNGTFRVWGNATIDGRELVAEPALFDWTG